RTSCWRGMGISPLDNPHTCLLLFVWQTPSQGVWVGNGDRDMEDTTREDILKRLKYIEGHLAGVRRMIQDDKYCPEILKQTFAVRRAIEKLEGILLEGHLHTCVATGIRDNREHEVISELMELYELANK
ncbi:MAG: metal-sensitive transcriptional regulator, partial [Acidimicrobiia bacterium]